ncbi:MAG: glucose PTS transporter subunit IIA, partial [Pseudomonadota bacterium]
MTSDAPLILGSPLEGWCAGLEDCPDAVFRDRLLGDGVSIDPVSGALRAPFDGTVLTLPASQHAVNLRADNGAEILIHVGIDTVGLSGEGFDALVAPGDRVKRGQLLLRFDLAVLASRAASCRTPVLLLRQEGYRLERLAAEGPIAFGEPLLAIHAPQRQVGASVEPAHDDSAFAPLSTTLRTGLAHGIHARPAAGLGAALKDLDVDAALVTAAGARADVRSPVALMGLGIGHGDVVHLEAQGPEAERAIGLLLPQLEPLPDAVGDAVQACNERPATEQEPQLAPSPPKPGERRAAQAAAPGLALGPVWQWRPWVPPQDIAVASPALELQALDEALAQVRGHLAHIARKEVGEGAAVATAHLALLDDPSLVQRARTLIGDGQGASAAWGAALEEAAAPLATLHDPRMQERCDDLEDLSRQVQRVLAG